MRITITKSFECDDDIAYAIIKLNQKGYKTEFCCSGHEDDLYPYILFDRWTSIMLNNSHPKNWIVDNNEDSSYQYRTLSIRRRFTAEELDTMTDKQLIEKAMNELAEWVDKLKPIPEPYVEYEYKIDGIEL